jgi:hypothetical protein
MYVLLQSRNKVVVTIINRERAAKLPTRVDGIANIICSFGQQKI